MSRDLALDEHFERFIDAQLASGRYNSSREVVEAGLRLLEDQDSALTASITDIRNTIDASRRSTRTVSADQLFKAVESKIRGKSRHG